MLFAGPRSLAKKKAHTDLTPKDYFMIFYCLIFFQINTVYIFIHVFAGHSINCGSCTRESIDTTTTIIRHFPPSTPQPQTDK